ncbi:MAG: MFS transporter [Alphaproteobacteria bacterium]|nr:MFS transporter [Alphaproteobacteria bacterium]
MTDASTFQSDVPARLERLPFGRFHRLIIFALGITWILDGLEVTVVGSLTGALSQHGTGLGLSNAQIGLAGSAYLVGAVAGALLFGDLADRFGRKRLFSVTVGVYLVATIATGLSWDFWSFVIFRALTGAGIGGEYSAINSAIQEFIPATRRGRVDLFVNGSYWIGAALGALGAIVVLDPGLIPPAIGWRLAFVVGGALALCIIVLRRFLPESPRWLMTHGRASEASRIVDEIERYTMTGDTRSVAPPQLSTIRLSSTSRISLADLVRTLVVRYPSRTVLGITLMATQAFCYNAIFFTYGSILKTFYNIAAANIGWFMLPFAAGNFLGPLLLGRWFDTRGRKLMIGGTYAMSGLLMLATGLIFAYSRLTAVSQTSLWTINFFFASAGASAAYLTVGECFPLEVRARTIAVFYAFGTAVGGVAAPAIFGALIDTNSRMELLYGYLLGGGLMLLASVVEAALGVAAEQVTLEEIAPPLSQVE